MRNKKQPFNYNNIEWDYIYIDSFVFNQEIGPGCEENINLAQ